MQDNQGQNQRANDIQDEQVRERVSDFYGRLARQTTSDTGCCAANDEALLEGPWGAVNYADGVLDGLPSAAGAASIGCGNPLARAELAAGQVVLDLGSGGGIDVLLSARRVGPTGFAFGLDMSDDMLDLARRNAAESGCENVEFLKGYLESIPLPDLSVDVVLSNCVVNLSPDKPAVFAETSRVLRPGGRLSINDVVAETAAATNGLEATEEWDSCFAGALTRTGYRSGLHSAGFTNIEISDGEKIRDGFSSVSITATKDET